MHDKKELIIPNNSGMSLEIMSNTPSLQPAGASVVRTREQKSAGIDRVANHLSPFPEHNHRSQYRSAGVKSQASAYLVGEEILSGSLPAHLVNKSSITCNEPGAQKAPESHPADTTRAGSRFLQPDQVRTSCNQKSMRKALPISYWCLLTQS